MLKLSNIAFLFSVICFINFSCKKELPEPKLGSIDLTNGYALIVQTEPDNSNLKPGQEPDFAKLYKLTDFDTLRTVKYFTPDGADMGFTYVPEAVYSLSDAYLFLTVSRKYSSPKVFESYLIRKYDGKAIAVEPEFHPQIASGGDLLVDSRSKAFRQGNVNDLFCYYNQSLGKITFSGVENYVLSNSSVPIPLGEKYEVDNEENIFTEGKIITYLSTLDVTTYKADKSIVAKAFSNGFFMVTAKDTSYEVSKITVENGSVKTQMLADLGKGASPWTFRGAASFPKWSNTFFVFDKGIIRVNAQESKVISLVPFSLVSIDLFDYSDGLFYITGTNVLNKKVFMLMNPSSNTITFTHTIAPNTYEVKKLEVTLDNRVTFVGTRISDNREVLGYIPESNLYIMKINHQGLKVKQMVAYK